MAQYAHRLVLAAIEAINARDEDGLVACLATDFVETNVSLESNLEGHEGARRGMNALLAAFPDAQFEPHELFATGDMVVVVWSLSATHLGRFKRIPPTGLAIQAVGTSIFHIRGLVISSGLHMWDLAGVLRSMRLLPNLSGITPSRPAEMLTSFFGRTG